MVQNYSPLSGKRHHAEKGKCQATDEPANSLVSPSGQRPQYAQHPSVRDEPGNMRQAVRLERYFQPRPMVSNTDLLSLSCRR